MPPPRCLKAISFLALLTTVPIASQDVTTFKDDVKLIEVYATVFDHRGRALDGLFRDQFEIRDDGAAQRIRVFETPQNSISCALLLDTTASMTEAIPTLRNSARHFIDALRPGDSVAVYTFSTRIEELSPMGADKGDARRALIRIRAGGRTALFDSISQLALSLQAHPGKKVIVVFTDGGDNASILNRQSAASRSRKAGIPVFAIAEGDAAHDNAASGLLHELAEATGGHMYKAPKSNDIDNVFASISDDLQNGYLLAFQAPSEATPPLWHELQVLVKNTPKPVTVRARTGYSGE